MIIMNIYEYQHIICHSKKQNNAIHTRTQGIALSKFIANNICLTYLDLSWNPLRDKGVFSIAKSLYNNNYLTTLKLGWTGFGVKVLVVVCEC